MKTGSSRQKALLEAEVQDLPACQHHWVIDKPAGPVSKGVCRLCSEEREFQNYVEGSYWSSDVSLEQLSGGSRVPAGIDVSEAGDDSTPDEDA